ncbi:FmdB family zinc ribbon protein [Aeromicrobium fastidiosum]|uniref:FmdB family transcriptional regulator n=1 Tax=Aeromicrobium fastidiosum TaxID=52699 RepID=A0A641ANM3_9ACTN|nr:FmdB family zinc ribbon protein [Aeromicrobium fastidiosum]KAA1379686.1 FmdB family transcriptional regulator [Aeromicrobium fastidiosum]MBP2389167.1 putative FmdB family regulatory protein [Aeromicrobium fastidiosum]
MPKYQYQCKDCGEALEVQQSFTDDALTVCPTCGGDLRKVFNAVGVVFKGSGFYKTDSRSGSSSSTSSSGSSNSSSSSSDSSKPAGDGGGTSAAKSEPAASKPATKSGSDSAA